MSAYRIVLLYVPRIDYSSPSPEGNGKISTRQLGTLARAFGFTLSHAQLQDLIAEYDKDGKGSIDFPNFLKLMGRIALGDVQSDEEKATELMEAFRAFDTEGKGTFSAEELKKIVMSIGGLFSFN